MHATIAILSYTQPAFDAAVNFCRAMLCISSAYAVMRYLCVCLSVTFVHSVKTSNRILRLFPPPGSHTVLAFMYQRQGTIPTGTPLPGASSARGYGK